MKDLQQIAFTDLENDEIYLLALIDNNCYVPELKVATGAEIKEFILMENECMFDDDDNLLTDDLKLQLIEENFDVEVYALAFIMP
jgi:hypothetical protein